MSHRTALALSIVLTLVLAVGVIAARDQLFAAETAADTVAVSSEPPAVLSGSQDAATVDAPGETVNAAGMLPRVIEIPVRTQEDATLLPLTDDGEREDRLRSRYDDDDEGEEDD